MAAQTFVMPGQVLPEDVLPVPRKSTIPLKLGPGLRHTPPSTITTTLAGPLCIDRKKNAIWVENNGGRVGIDSPGRWDVMGSSAYLCSIYLKSTMLSLLPYTIHLPTGTIAPSHLIPPLLNFLSSLLKAQRKRPDPSCLLVVSSTPVSLQPQST